MDSYNSSQVNSSVNDYDITSISYNLNDNYLSTGSTSIGGVLIDSESVIVNSGTTTNIVSIGDTYHSAKVLVTIAPDVSNPSLEILQLLILMNLKHRS